jgi:hypothetical protein
MKVSRRWASWFVLGSLAVWLLMSLTGCGEEEVVDPYYYASLNDIMTGEVADSLHTYHVKESGEQVEYGKFAFEIDAPEFEYVDGQIGLVRDGNQLHFLVARDLESLAPRLSGAMLGVKMTFSPQPTHMVLERIKRGGVIEADSLQAPGPYVLPKLLPASTVDITEPGKDMTDASWKDRKTLMALMPENEEDPPLRFQTGVDTIVKTAHHAAPDSVKADPTEDDMAYYAVLPMGAWEIVDLAPGADYMLDMLIAEDLPLVGSVSPISWVEDYQLRKQEHEVIGHVVGTLHVNWFKYANAFVEGFRPEY